ncbi:cyclin domain protein [Viridothelium virens]|uniref:Cyclin domain protein n=1 Tax=Viridothelium virens TaxID=1048519 RepID=A0A6A6H8Q6_VIRVR|nr:cyclin domain protein [Viridothelium virens]
MAPIITGLSHLANPLATPEQLATSPSQLDGVPSDLEVSLRYAGARLTQIAGILLRLPQDIVAQAVVIFTRFWVGESGSLLEFGIKDVSAASVYLVAKNSPLPKSPRSIVNVYALLEAKLPSLGELHGEAMDYDPDSHYVSEGTYQASRSLLMKIEAQMLRKFGFQTHVATPYALCINYLQALDVIGRPKGEDVAARSFAYLNTSLLNPQLPYLTNQPSSLATASVYLAARELEVKLPGGEWWEVFDVDREELGFLVVGMLSTEGFILDEQKKWERRKIPMTVAEVEDEIDRRRILNGED